MTQLATPDALGLDPLPPGIEIKTTEPPNVEIHMADGIFIKQMWIRNALTFIPQHVHDFDHTSMLARGSVFLWKDGKLDRRYEAPTGILIKAGVRHMFLSLEDDTIIYCIHQEAHAMQFADIADAK